MPVAVSKKEAQPKMEAGLAVGKRSQSAVITEENGQMSSMHFRAAYIYKNHYLCYCLGIAYKCIYSAAHNASVKGQPCMHFTHFPGVMYVCTSWTRHIHSCHNDQCVATSKYLFLSSTVQSPSPNEYSYVVQQQKMVMQVRL